MRGGARGEGGGSMKERGSSRFQARVIRGCHAALRDESRRDEDVAHAIIAVSRCRPSDVALLVAATRDHWVALTVNVNATDLDRGEWIGEVGVITRTPVYTESPASPLPSPPLLPAASPHHSPRSTLFHLAKR